MNIGEVCAIIGILLGVIGLMWKPIQKRVKTHEERKFIYSRFIMIADDPEGDDFYNVLEILMHYGNKKFFQDYWNLYVMITKLREVPQDDPSRTNKILMLLVDQRLENLRCRIGKTMQRCWGMWDLSKHTVAGFNSTYRSPSSLPWGRPNVDNEEELK